MTTILKNVPQQGVTAAVKELRARDAVQATQDYEAERTAVRIRSEHLRALRLENEVNNPPVAPVKPRAKPAKKTRGAITARSS